VGRSAARTVKRPGSISIQGVFQLTGDHGNPAATPVQVFALCAIFGFTHRSNIMEGLSPVHRRVAGIDVHRMQHAVTVLIE
jgi:hypothetical protein